MPWVVASGLLSGELLLNLANLVVDESAVRADAVQASHVGASLVDAAHAVGVTGGFREKEDSATQDDSPQSRKTVGNAPLSIVGVVLGCAVVDHVGSPDTEGDKQLVGGDSGTTNALRDRLRLVHGDNCGKSSDTETSDETTHGELNPNALGSNLNDHTGDVGESGTRDGQTTTVCVGKRGGAQATEQGADTEQTNDGTLTNGRELAVLAKPLQEIGHLEETRDLSRLVSEHETTNTGNGSEDNGDSRDATLGFDLSTVTSGGDCPCGSLSRCRSLGSALLGHPFRGLFAE